MLEDVRVYIMKRLVVMSKLSQNLEDIITPIRKHLDNLKRSRVVRFMHLNKEPDEGLEVVELVQVVVEGSSAGRAGSSVGGASLSTGRGGSCGVKGKRRRAEKEQPQMRTYVKKRGRSERIANMQGKNFKFDDQGTSSALDRAFSVSS
ncbi:hypothetical protein Tco_0835596 [Tanacetum coccineum]